MKSFYGFNKVLTSLKDDIFMQTVTNETCTIFDRTEHLHLPCTFGALEDFKDKGKSQDGSYFFRIIITILSLPFRKPRDRNRWTWGFWYHLQGFSLAPYNMNLFIVGMETDLQIRPTITLRFQSMSVAAFQNRKTILVLTKLAQLINWQTWIKL